MLRYLDLRFIDYSLNNTDGKALVGEKAQLLYVRMIIKHFRGMPVLPKSLSAFIITEKELPWSKWQKELTELTGIGLMEIVITNEVRTYKVVNKWMSFVNMAIFFGKYKTMEVYAGYLSENIELKKLVCTREDISEKQVSELISLFIDEQNVVKRIYKDEDDAVNHFSNWVKTNKGYLKDSAVRIAKGTPIKVQGQSTIIVDANKK